MDQNISLFDGTAWYLVFLFSVTVHEASHALAALKLGDDTAHQGGQVSLDPTPHIRREPIGMVVVPFLSYILSGWMMGWASAPYDPHWAARYPKRAALMSLAGPASNLLLAIICGVFIALGLHFGFFTAPDALDFDRVTVATREGLPNLFAILLSIGFSLNLLLFLFNLIPFPPLDGSCIPLLFLSEEAANRYSDLLRAPGIGMIGLIVAWKISGAIFWPVFAFALGLVY